MTRCLGMLALLLCVLLPGPAMTGGLPPGTPPAAAEPPATDRLGELLRSFPEGLTAEQMDAVLGVMGDEELRSALRSRLRAEVAPGAEGQVRPVLLDLYAERLGAIAGAYPRLPEAIAEAFLHPAGSPVRLSPWGLMVSVAGLLATGFAAMWAARRALAGLRRRITGPVPSARRHLSWRVALNLVLDICEVAAFPLALVAGYLLLSPSHPMAGHVLGVLLRAVTVVLLVAVVARLLCAPQEPSLRLVPLAQLPARRLHDAMIVTAGLVAGVSAIVQLLAGLGLGQHYLRAVGLPLSAVPYLWLLFLLWRYQRPMLLHLARTLRLRREAARALTFLPVLVSLYLAGLWVTLGAAALRGQDDLAGRVLASFALLLAAPAVALGIRGALVRLYRDEEGKAATPGSPAALHLHRLMRAIWIVVAVLTVLATAWTWGFEPGQVGLGGAVLRVLFDLGAVLLLAYVAWALIERLVERGLARARREGTGGRAQRLATLLPLLRSFLHVVLLAMLGMILLSSLGIEIGPLLAGAGVVGIAIGLGAQSSIADILAGVFFLLEDAFHVGDYVEVGNLRGTVEGISLRSLKLRHHRGAVHTLPFGRIPSLTNYSRDWALMRLEFRVRPETDVALVKKLVKRIGQELAADPELGPHFIEPLKSQGVRRVEDDAVIIGIKYIARPGEQFVIRREAYQRILGAFRENGIGLVGRGVVVKVEGGEAGPEVAGAAAGEVIRRQIEERATGT